MRNTSLCYIERGGKYLMLHRVKKTIDENKDKWIGIGGKFEEGESPEDCVMREVLWGTEYMHLFTSDDFSGTPRECDEGVLEWIEKEHLLSLPIWEGDKIFLRLLDTDEPFFSLKLCYQGDRLIQAVLNGKKI